MNVFVFDTETTGLIDKKNPDLSKQPYIIQFAWILWELQGNSFREIARIDQFIKPKIAIPYESSQIHHIYDIDVQNAPPIEQVINTFLNYLNEADIVIWHNVEYDEGMLKLELARLFRIWEYHPNKVVCTMKESVQYCAIQWNGENYKYPKLRELHRVLFWEYFSGAHDAMKDVEATLNCFVELVKRDVITVEISNLMRLF